MKKNLKSFPNRMPKSFPCQAARGHAVVKMYRTPHKGYCDFKLPYQEGGQRKFHSFSDYERARGKGNDMLDQLLRGDSDAITLTASDKLVYTRAVAALRPLKVKLDVAGLQFVEAHKALAGLPVSIVEAARSYAKRYPAKMPDKSVADVVDEFIKDKRAKRKSELYVQDLNYRLGRFKKDFAVNISRIDGEQLRDFLDGLNLSARSYNNFRLALVTLFKFAKKRKYLPFDWDEFDGVDKMKDGVGAIEIFTPENLADLFTHASEQLVPFLAIGAFAGLRSAEIERLDWKDVKFSTGYIVVEAAKAKTAARRTIRMTDNLKEWLQDYAKKRGRVWPHSKPYLYEALAKLATTAKVTWKHNALRHSFISYRVAETGAVNETSLEAGNTPAMIFSNYRQVVVPEEAKRWFSICPSEGAEKVTCLKAAA
jgi:integrase